MKEGESAEHLCLFFWLMNDSASKRRPPMSLFPYFVCVLKATSKLEWRSAVHVRRDGIYKSRHCSVELSSPRRCLFLFAM